MHSASALSAVRSSHSKPPRLPKAILSRWPETIDFAVSKTRILRFPERLVFGTFGGYSGMITLPVLWRVAIPFRRAHRLASESSEREERNGGGLSLACEATNALRRPEEWHKEKSW